MANLTDSTNLTGTITVSKATGTKVVLDTNHKYLNKDIELTINAQTATPAFTGGGVSGTASASAINATISDSTNNSGVSIVAAGSATRAQVTYNGAVGGWVTKANGAEALTAGGATALTNKTYYINGVTIPIPSSGNNIFNITVPNGNNDTVTFVFKVDSNGETYVDTLTSIISFTVDGASYTATSGMTWTQWIASAYNVDSFYVDNNKITRNTSHWLATAVATSSSVFVTPSDTIISGEAYIRKNSK